MKKNNSWKCVPKRRDALAQLRRSAIWLFLPVLLFISLCASCGQEPAVVGMDAVPTESGVPPAQDVRSVLHIAVLGFAAILGGVFLGVFLSRWKTQRDDRVTQQIVQQNQFHETAIESLTYPFLVINASDHTVEMANSAARKYFLKGETTCYAMTHDRSKPCQETGYICPLEEVVRTGKPASSVHTHILKDGDERRVNIHAYPVFDDKKRVVKVIENYVDITDRERAENALREEKEKLLALLSNTGDLISAMDEEYNILFMSGPLLELFGDRSGEKCYAVFCGLDEPCGVNCAVDEVIRKGKSSFSYTHSDEEDLRDGRIVGDAANIGLPRTLETVARPFEYRGKRCVVEVSRDVSERLRAEAALLRVEEEGRKRLTEILEATNLWVTVINEDYGIEYINRPMSESLSDRVQETCYQLDGKKAPCDVTGSTSRCSVKEILHGGKPSVQYMHVDPPEQGGRHMMTWCYPLDYGGKRCVIEVHRDVTQQAHLEEQLRQSQKMEAVGQLAGGIAHDFNNLLQAILGYTQMGMLGLSDEEQRCKDLVQVKKAAERAATLTRQLLAFSRRQMIQPTKLDLNQVIDSLSKMLRRMISEDIELNLVLGNGTRTVSADPGALEQILMNLCLNARDAMPSDGQITLKTHDVALDEEFTSQHLWARPGHYVCLSATDTGTGMPPDVLARVFDPFFTTKEVGKGTGLGLSMVYGIVKQHDGLITCSSEPGHGSTFSIYFPTVEGTAATPETDGEGSDTRKGTETVLLAEDEKLVRELAVRVLEGSGYRVFVACDGEEALQIFKAHKDEIDCALLDVVMPKASGREVRDAILIDRPNLPILFSSGYSPGEIKTQFILEEGAQLVQKPYDPGTLLTMLRERLDADKQSSA